MLPNKRGGHVLGAITMKGNSFMRLGHCKRWKESHVSKGTTVAIEGEFIYHLR